MTNRKLPLFTLYSKLSIKRTSDIKSWYQVTEGKS